MRYFNERQNRMTEQESVVVADEHKRTIRSFVLRQGHMTASQQRAIDTLWSQFGVDYQTTGLDLNQCFGREQAKVLEIGFGMGVAVWQLGQKSNGGLKALTKEMLPSTASQPKATAVEVERPSEQLAANQYIWAMVGAADVNLRTCAAMSCEVVGILPAHQAVAVHPRSQTDVS